MKKLLFFLSTAILLYLLYIVINLLIIGELNSYGKGYFTGNIILLMVFGFLSYWLGKKIFN